jgi:hypothetical protein
VYLVFISFNYFLIESSLLSLLSFGPREAGQKERQREGYSDLRSPFFIVGFSMFFLALMFARPVEHVGH